MKKIYVIAVHKGGRLAPVVIANNKKEAKILAEASSELGRVIVWKAEEWYPHKIE